MSVLQSFPTPGTLEGIRSSLFTFRQRRPVLSKQRFVGFGNFLEFFLRPLRVVLQDMNYKDQGAPIFFLLEIQVKLTKQYLIWMILECKSPKSSLHLVFCWLGEESKNPGIILPSLPPHVAVIWIGKYMIKMIN